MQKRDILRSTYRKLRNRLGIKNDKNVKLNSIEECENALFNLINLQGFKLASKVVDKDNDLVYECNILKNICDKQSKELKLYKKISLIMSITTFLAVIIFCVHIIRRV